MIRDKINEPKQQQNDTHEMGKGIEVNQYMIMGRWFCQGGREAMDERVYIERQTTPHVWIHTNTFCKCKISSKQRLMLC